MLLGDGFPAGVESRAVAVSGVLVFEPYLWGDGGVLACASGVGPVAGTVRAVRALSVGTLVDLDLAVERPARRPARVRDRRGLGDGHTDAATPGACGSTVRCTAMAAG